MALASRLGRSLALPGWDSVADRSQNNVVMHNTLCWSRALPPKTDASHFPIFPLTIRAYMLILPA
jgi:hypothetical protein